MDWLYYPTITPHLLEAYGSPSFAFPTSPIIPPMPPTRAMSQQVQFIAPPESTHSTGDCTVPGHLVNILADSSNLASPPDNVGAPDAKAVRRRNAEAQRQYRERKKRQEQELHTKVAELVTENAKLKAKNEGLVSLLRSRYSHDPAFDLELILLGVSEDIPLDDPGPPIITYSDYSSTFSSGRFTIPSDAAERTSQTFGVDSQIYRATTADTSSNSDPCL